MARTTQKQREEAAQETEIAARRRAVVQYRLLGLTYRAIGEKLGISHEQARVDEMAARAEVKAGTEETIEELRARENERLDMARSAIATQVLKGDLKAVDRWLNISERTAKLNGLDAPTKIAPVEPDGKKPWRPDLSRLSDVELDLALALAEKLEIHSSGENQS